MPLNQHQQRGMAQYQLTEAQVSTEGFGAHTLYAIDKVRRMEKDLPVAEAYKWVANLSVEEAFAERNAFVRKLKPHFSRETRIHIRDVMDEQRCSIADAYAKVQGLDSMQVRGVRLGLTREQVQVENFSVDTVIAIMETRQHSPNISLQDAYEKFKGLDTPQINGIGKGLSRQEVNSPNFGQHTINAAVALYWDRGASSIKEGFKVVRGLDANQAEFWEDRATPEQVRKRLKEIKKSQAPAEGQVRVGNFNVPAPGGPRINQSGKGHCVIL